MKGHFYFLIRGLVMLFCVLIVTEPSVAGSKKPLKVFILVGQSNMQGHARVETMEHIGMDPKTEPMLRAMQNGKGVPLVCKDVWISYLSTRGVKHGALTVGYGADERKIGPELMFGIRVRELVEGPVLIIKAAWGGKSLHTDFRSPSAGPYVFNEGQIENFMKRGKDLEKEKAEKVKATGHFYRLTIGHVRSVLTDISKVCPDYDDEIGYELGGVVWFQGWNDMVDGEVYPDRSKPSGYDAYSEMMAHFIRDIRKDLKAPKLPCVIGVMGAGGPVSEYGANKARYKSTHQEFRKAMAAPADLLEFRGNVAAVWTEKYWDRELGGLVDRNNKLKGELRKIVREKKLEGKEVHALRDKMRGKEFSERELEVLEKGVSNAGYHYLGSAKILSEIGKAFAEAVVKLQQKK